MLVTVCDAVSITDTVSSLALVTYAVEPSALNAVFHGVRPTEIRPDRAQVRGPQYDDLVPLGVGDVRLRCRPGVTVTPCGLLQTLAAPCAPGRSTS